MKVLSSVDALKEQLSYGGQVWLPSPWMELADQLNLRT